MSPEFEQALIDAVALFFLVFLRVTGMFVVSPIFGRQNLPVYYKLGFSFFIALIMTSSAPIVSPGFYGNAPEYVYYAAREFIIGASIGFIPYLMFSAIYMAGQMIDMKIGFSMVNVLDPVSNVQIPITANFYFILCMLMFITVNAHHMVILTISHSYSIIPLGRLNMDGEVMATLMRLFSDVFIVGFRIAAPIVFTVLLADVALGTISKAMPQINVFMVGMPLKILVGIVIMIVTMPTMLIILGELFKNIGNETVNFMRGLGAG
ncbi:MAG: flagellar type III secretion system protein FliR [Oscillospiraceae bacterium]|nr:flagellar type III secretion system protein FliR [Oscillospiraceae bacterium]